MKKVSQFNVVSLGSPVIDSDSNKGKVIFKNDNIFIVLFDEDKYNPIVYTRLDDKFDLFIDTESFVKINNFHEVQLNDSLRYENRSGDLNDEIGIVIEKNQNSFSVLWGDDQNPVEYWSHEDPQTQWTIYKVN